MHSKTPARSVDLQPEERLRQLEAFVSSAVESIGQDREDAILLVARSPESPIARAVFSLSGALARRGLGGRIVFACSEAMAAGDVWQLSFDGNFNHETRLLPDPRALGAHEQLIIGDSALWFGDSMRRDPTKRDAFQSFTQGDDAATARRTFARLWQTSLPLYGHAAGEMSPAAGAGTATATIATDLRATRASDGDTTETRRDAPAPVNPDIAATLAGWQPPIKH